MRWDEVTVSGYLQNRSIGLHPYDTHRTNIFRLQSGQVTKGDQVRHTMSCPPTCDGFCLVPSSCCCGGCEWLSEHLTFPSDPDQKRLCQASCTALVHRSDTKASKPLHLDNNLCRRALLRYLNRAGSYSMRCGVVIADLRTNMSSRRSESSLICTQVAPATPKHLK